MQSGTNEQPAVRTIYSQVIGSPGIFDQETNVKIYFARLKNFFAANGITQENKKRAILLTSISEEVHKTLFSLCLPEDPDNKTFESLADILLKHYEPKKSYFAARHQLYLARKNHDESVPQWGARVRELASKCGFGPELEIVVRDIFVVGMGSGKIQDRLLEEDASAASTTWAKMMEVATTREANINASKEWSKETPGAFHFTKQEGSTTQTTPKRTSERGQTNGKEKCQVCGRSNHDTRLCRFKNYSCNTCGVAGHLAPMCKNKGNKHKSQNKFLTENERSGDHESSVELNDFFFTINDISRDKLKVAPYRVKLVIGGKPISFEIDTGSVHSIISESTFKALIGPKVIVTNDVELSDYVGNRITPIGKVALTATYNNKKIGIWVYIVPNGGPPILGRNDIATLGIKNVFECKFTGAEDSVKTILKKYPNVFSEELGTFKGYKISLTTKPGTTPKFFKHRPVPLALRIKVEAEIDRLLAINALIPVDHSEWATPVVPILKEDGSVRLCGDFKITVNPVLVSTEYPLPKIEHLYARIAGAKYFSKIDLKDAYQQLVLDDNSRALTTINTIKGLFRYTRVPFGLKSSASEFQKAIESITKKVEGVEVFIDDIIVSGRTMSEHNIRLEQLLKALGSAGLRVRERKCTFMQTEVEYLGHKIDGQGLHTLDKHTIAIKEAAAPQDRSELKSFLGLVTYYTKFVENAARILKPLYDLLKMGAKWSWSKEADEAFNSIKSILSSKPVLDHYDPSVPIKLMVDASSFAIGAVISQVYGNAEKPVAYASRVLSEAERKYPQIEKEGLAIIYGVQKFYDYLYARKFTLITDHKPLFHIFGEKKGIPIYAANRLQRWAYVLTAFDFDISFVKSGKNAADFLSRIRIGTTDRVSTAPQCLNFIYDNCPFNVNWVKIKTQTRTDKILSQVIKAINTGEWPTGADKNESLKSYYTRRHEISTEQDCLMWGYRVIMPSKLREALLTELHSTHAGMSCMKAIARSYFWWPGIDNDIEYTARKCENCIQVRPAPPKAVLTPWKWPEQVWTRIHVDFLGPYKNKHFLIVVDATSKWLEVFEVSTSTASVVIVKMQELFARFGVPKSITTDGAKCFTGTEFSTFCVNGNIKHLVGAPFHPETNGAAESGVKIVKNFFKKNQTTSPTLLQKFLLFYRNTPHSATRQTPAKLLLGRSTRTQFDMLIPSTKDVVSDHQDSQIKRHGKRQHEIQQGDTVAVRDYRTNENKWSIGTVTKNVGKQAFEVDTEAGTWKRHIDQTIKIPNRDSGVLEVECNQNPSDPRGGQVPEETGKDTDGPDMEPETTSTGRSRPTRTKRSPDRYTSVDFRK